MNKKAKNAKANYFVLVSNQLLGPSALPIGFAFRTEPLDQEDSGWNFWSGEETEDFVKNAQNFVRYPMQTFLDLDETLEDIIDAEIGTAWEKDEESEIWVEAEGY